jgi:hyperosmotically inducible protein
MNIKVDTDNGVVKLSGNAKSQAEADKAAEIAKNTEGVASVSNDIRVNAASAKY